MSELVGSLDEQSKFSYELYQSCFYLSQTISGVLPNPKLSVLHDLSPSFRFAWSLLTLTFFGKCPILFMHHLQYISCQVFSKSSHCVLPWVYFHVNGREVLLYWEPLYLQQLVLQTARVMHYLPVNTVFVHVFVWHTHLTLKIFFFIIHYLIICTEITNTTLIFEVCPPLPCSLYCHCNIFPFLFLHSLERFLFSFNSSQEGACISIISKALAAATSFASFCCLLGVLNSFLSKFLQVIPSQMFWRP